jgi:hypothetical protein
MDDSRLRAIIVKLQDRLSDDDRKRLHFYLGDVVPRRIRDDPSLGGTLSLMESLFERDKISGKDFTFLINAFDKIQRLDAVNLLKGSLLFSYGNDLFGYYDLECLRRSSSNGSNVSIESLSVTMPPMVSQTAEDEYEDLMDDKKRR